MQNNRTIASLASDDFRNAATPADLMAVGAKHKAAIAALETSTEFYAQGTYLWLRECFKYYMGYLTGKTPGVHPRVAHEKALATGVYERPPVRQKYVAKGGAKKKS